MSNFNVLNPARWVVAVVFLSAVAVPGFATTCYPPKPVRVSGRFCGQLLQQGGKPAPNVEIRLRDDKSRRTRVVVRTDAKGRFAFPAVPEGEYLVDAGDAGYVDTIEITDGFFQLCANRQTVLLPMPIISCTGGILRPTEKPATEHGNGLKKDR